MISEDTYDKVAVFFDYMLSPFAIPVWVYLFFIAVRLGWLVLD